MRVNSLGRRHASCYSKPPSTPGFGALDADLFARPLLRRGVFFFAEAGQGERGNRIVYTYTYIYIYACIYVCIYIYVTLYIIHIYIYIYIYIDGQ